VFGDILQRGKVIDYGCGQGALVTSLLSHHVDVIGTDISLEGCETDIPNDRFIPLAYPWAIPERDADAVCLLDVIEHHQNPVAFLKDIHRRNYEYVIVKVPMLNGPIGTISRLLAAIGRTALLRQLLLVGDISPHYAYFTRRGLLNSAAAAGYDLHGSLRIADVGKELPERSRTQGEGVGLHLLRPFLIAVGLALECIAPLWSDTEVFVFSPVTSRAVNQQSPHPVIP
jgi:hypothetical protein